MNTKSIKILIGLAMLACASAFAGGPPAWQTNAIPIPGGLLAVNNSTNVITTNSTSLTLPQGVPVALTLVTVDGASATGTSNSYVGFNFTSDGTSWTTGRPLYMTNTANTSTNVCTVLITNLSGNQGIRLDEHTSRSITTNTIVSLTASWFQ